VRRRPPRFAADIRFRALLVRLASLGGLLNLAHRVIALSPRRTAEAGGNADLDLDGGVWERRAARDPQRTVEQVKDSLEAELKPDPGEATAVPSRLSPYAGHRSLEEAGGRKSGEGTRVEPCLDYSSGRPGTIRSLDSW
jgi:hypothetical protein